MTDRRPEAEACVTRFLSRRDHSTGELRAKLSKRGFESDLIESVIAACVDAGWVNDEAFAQHQAEVLADQGWGPAQIRAKLQRHGVDNGLATTTIDALDVDWIDAARGRVARKFGDLEDGDHERAFRHLTYRGFSPNTARRAIFDDPIL